MLNHCPPASHLYIAIPAYTGWIHTETTNSLMTAVPFLVRAGITVSHRFMTGSCFIDHARNHLSADFLGSRATDLLFVDHDVGFRPETLLKLCLATRPVVAALYPKKEDPIGFPAFFGIDDPKPDNEGLVECTFMPTGFMRINRAVFEAMPHHRYKDRDGRLIGDWFRADMRDQHHGEDFEFCRRWRDIGGKVYFLPNETLTHSGVKTWRGNWSDHNR